MLVRVVATDGKGRRMREPEPGFLGQNESDMDIPSIISVLLSVGSSVLGLGSNLLSL